LNRAHRRDVAGAMTVPQFEADEADDDDAADERVLNAEEDQLNDGADVSITSAAARTVRTRAEVFAAADSGKRRECEQWEQPEQATEH
jgi:hypothetical protein